MNILDLKLSCDYKKMNVKEGKYKIIFNINNKYFRNRLRELSITGFEIIGLYKDLNTDIEIYHKKCRSIFRDKPKNFLRRGVKCKNCLDGNINKPFNDRMRFENIEGFSLVSNYKNMETDVMIYHSLCKKTFLDKPKNFFNRDNKCLVCSGMKSLQNKNREEKNRIFQEMLDFKNTNMVLIGDYIDAYSEVNLVHKTCGRKFVDTHKNLKALNYKCPFCETNRYIYGYNVKMKDKILYLEKKLDFKYKILNYFVTNEDEIELIHKRCNTKFKSNVKNLLRVKNKDFICPNCNEKHKKEVFQNKLDSKFGHIYDVIGNYVNRDLKIKVRHLGCNKAFYIEPKKLLWKKEVYCPLCVSNNMNKKEASMKNRLFKKFKGRYIMCGEYKGDDVKTMFKCSDTKELFWDIPQYLLRYGRRNNRN